MPCLQNRSPVVPYPNFFVRGPPETEDRSLLEKMMTLTSSLEIHHEKRTLVVAPLGWAAPKDRQG